MRRSPNQLIAITIVGVALLAFAIAGLVGGPANAGDVSVIRALAAERLKDVALTHGAIAITQIGGFPGMIGLLAVAAAMLAVARRWREGEALAGIVLGGRIAIELLKLAIDRQRPTLTPYPVEVASLSFPSGHAGNSMITFLAIALIAVPGRWRAFAVAIGIALSLTIGVTRPFLGVHWPSDIIGGWAFGIGWVVALVWLSRGWRHAT